MPELTPTARQAAITAARTRRRISVLGLAALLPILLFLGGCGTNGWDDRERLKQLYPVDADGRMTQADKVRSPNRFQRFLRTFIGPFGYAPTGSEEKLDDPGADGRETILRLSGRLDGNVSLIAFAVPRFAELAVGAPYELTRAQAVTALATALDRQLPPQPPISDAFREDAESVRLMIRMLLGVDVEQGEQAGRAPDLPIARKVALIRNLSETRYETLQFARNAMLTLGYVSRTRARRDRAIRHAVRVGIYRLAREVCRLTLDRIQQSEERDLVRGAAARAMAKAREPWGEEMLLKMVLLETEAPVLRKVYRALDAYRTKRVARQLLGVLKSDPDPLRDALARRGLLNFTQQPMGPDPAAWEKKLRQLGYLDDV
jgi:hypothetical protein